MTKETVKEIGKLCFDIAKIIFAIAVFGSMSFIAGGVILINKGTENE